MTEGRVPWWVVVLVGLPFAAVYVGFFVLVPYIGVHRWGTAGLIVALVVDLTFVVLFMLRMTARARAYFERVEAGREPIDFSKPVWRRFMP